MIKKKLFCHYQGKKAFSLINIDKIVNVEYNVCKYTTERRTIMAFFDDLTKKVSKATQTVAQKGRDIADITKMNIAIAEEEKKIEELYKKIGKLFVERVGGSVEGEFADMVSEIKAAEAKIEDCKQQIKDLKGIVICPKCGNELSAEAAFCNNCGEKITKAEQPKEEVNAKPVCKKCGAEVSADAAFCNNCGEKLN